MQAGRDLDALIAEKVMGLEICKCDHEALRAKHFKEYRDNMKDSYLGYYSEYCSHGSNGKCNTCTKLYLPVNKYSTSISDAWEVVEKSGILNQYFLYQHDAGWIIQDHSKRPHVEGDTAPHAICLAALKALGLKDPV